MLHPNLTTVNVFFFIKQMERCPPAAGSESKAVFDPSVLQVAIIGAGLIGQSWAIAFARAGHPVAMFDPDGDALRGAHRAIAESCRTLSRLDLLGGRQADSVLKDITPVDDLETAVATAVHVQENAPEDPTVKRDVFAAIDAASRPDAVIASSTSALLPSELARGLKGAHRCLVAHPLNPPHLIPAVEIVPGPQTSPDVVVATETLLRAIGQNPVKVTREVEGFVMNRLQGALLDEAFAMIQQGLASVEDIDIAMRDGLARRWVFMGPFETIDLNAPGGITDFIDRYGPAYERIGAHRPNRPAWRGALRKTVADARAGVDRKARSTWRDDRLAALARFLTSAGSD